MNASDKTTVARCLRGRFKRKILERNGLAEAAERTEEETEEETKEESATAEETKKGKLQPKTKRGKSKSAADFPQGVRSSKRIRNLRKHRCFRFIRLYFINNESFVNFDSTFRHYNSNPLVVNKLAATLFQT